MKSTWQIALFAILVVSNAYLIYQHFTSTEHLVYVDSARLINGYKGMATAKSAYQQKAIIWKSNIDTLVSDIQSEIKKYEKESIRMTTKERELTTKLIQSKQQQLADYQKAINDKAAKEDGQMTKQVLDEINQYIKDYGKRNNMRIILAATEYGNIAYANEAMDITDEILEGLNSKYEGR